MLSAAQIKDDASFEGSESDEDMVSGSDRPDLWQHISASQALDRIGGHVFSVATFLLFELGKQMGAKLKKQERLSTGAHARAPPRAPPPLLTDVRELLHRSQSCASQAVGSRTPIFTIPGVRLALKLQGGSPVHLSPTFLSITQLHTFAQVRCCVPCTTSTPSMCVLGCGHAQGLSRLCARSHTHTC